MKRITFTFLLFCAFVLVAQAQNALLLHSSDGNATAYSFDDLKKITFADDKIVFHTSSQTSVALSDVRKMTFGTISSVDDTRISHAVSLFPNPATSFIALNGSVNGSNYYQIYDVQGKLQLQGYLNEAQIISVEMLRAGLYILRIGNTNLKFSKL